MNKIVLSIVLAIAFVAGSSTKASAEVETAENVVKLTVHVTNEDGTSWKKSLDFGRPVSTALKPCPDVQTSVCVYVVGARGKETEWYSFSAYSYQPIYKFEYTQKKPARPIKVARR